MSLPSKIFDLYIKASLHVALAVTAFAYVTVQELGLTHDVWLYGFIFSSTILSYNLTKYISVAASDSILTSPLLKWIGGITALSFLTTCVLLFYLPADVIIAALIFGSVTVAYALPISEEKKNLRNIYGIKIIVIAFVWAGVTVGLPVLNAGLESVEMTNPLYEGIQRLLFVSVLILPFDIRDYRSDDPTLGTLPQLLGVNKTRILGLILLSVCLVIEWVQNPEVSGSFLIFFFMTILTAVMVRRSMVKQSAYFASFWVEGIPIGWALLLYLIELI
ncbi:hypothetical protein [Rhodohalobacter sp. 8-1]|uniref:hypothetical protein n=1 Tax=Rhodohalobacter sp. 8-1 TaxID=3131972 RepID=UPI0030EF55CB